MDITAEILNKHGYVISSHVDSELITRCKNEILKAYIEQIFTEGYNEEDDDVLNASYCLTYLLLLRRSVFMTNSGAKQKTSRQSDNVSLHEINQLTESADMYLNILIEKDGATSDPSFYDVARVYNLTTLI